MKTYLSRCPGSGLWGKSDGGSCSRSSCSRTFCCCRRLSGNDLERCEGGEKNGGKNGEQHLRGLNVEILITDNTIEAVARVKVF